LSTDALYFSFSEESNVQINISYVIFKGWVVLLYW